MLNEERCVGMATKSFNVSVTEAQGWFVEQQVRLGRYNNISEVVHDGLRRLDEKTVQRTEHHGVDKPTNLTEPLIL